MHTIRCSVHEARIFGGAADYVKGGGNQVADTAVLRLLCNPLECVGSLGAELDALDV